MQGTPKPYRQLELHRGISELDRLLAQCASTVGPPDTEPWPQVEHKLCRGERPAQLQQQRALDGSHELRRRACIAARPQSQSDASTLSSLIPG